MATKAELERLAEVLREMVTALAESMTMTDQWQAEHTADEIIFRQWDRPSGAIFALESFPVDSLAGAKLPREPEAWCDSLVEAGEFILHHHGDEWREECQQRLAMLHQGRNELRKAILKATNQPAAVPGDAVGRSVSHTLAAVATDDQKAVTGIADDQNLSLDAKMAKICTIHADALKWTSPKWARVLKRDPSRIRQTETWKRLQSAAAQLREGDDSDDD